MNRLQHPNRCRVRTIDDNDAFQALEGLGQDASDRPANQVRAVARRYYCTYSWYKMMFHIRKTPEPVPLAVLRQLATTAGPISFRSPILVLLATLSPEGLITFL